MATVELKVCPVCGETKDLGGFYRDVSKARGVQSRCKVCESERMRRRYEKNRERMLAAMNARAAAKRELLPPKLCRRCGGELPSRRWVFHPECLVQERAENPHRSGRRSSWGSDSPAARGYGTEHKKLREAWARRIANGPVDCARCHRPIFPGDLWDLGHHDRDRSRYVGPEHRKCNRQTSKHRVKSFPW